MPSPPGVDYGDTLHGPVKFGNLYVVVIEASYTSAGTVLATDTAASSPGATATRTGVGVYRCDIPNGNFLVPLASYFALASGDPGAGNFVDLATENAATGVVTYEVSQTKGTAADPTGNGRFYFAFLVGAN